MGAVKVNVGTPANPVWVTLGGTGLVICTSTTRPASPLPGQQIYETDTGKTQWWTGVAWQMQSFIPNKTHRSRAVGQTITASTDTALLMGTSDYNVGPNGGFAYNNGFFTCPRAAYVRVTAFGQWSAANDGRRQMYVYQNSTVALPASGTLQAHTTVHSNQVGGIGTTVVAEFLVAANDLINIDVFHNSATAGGLSITPGSIAISEFDLP